MHDALRRLGEIFAELPAEWLYVDGDESQPVQLDFREVESLLKLPFIDSENFWKLP